METIKLEHFCAVVETGSLSKAAKVMGITHPGIHKSIRSLEDELSISLTKPKGRGIEITEQGIELYQKAKIIIEQTNRLSSIRKSKKTIRLGLNEAFNYFIPTQLLAVSSNFSFHERCPGEIEPSIGEGVIDYGLTFFPRNYHGVIHEEIGKVEYVLINYKKAKLSDIKSFITPTSTYQSSERDMWNESLFPRLETIKTNMLSIALELFFARKGALFLPKNILESKSLRFSSNYHKVDIPNHLAIEAPVFLCWREGEPLSKKLKSVLKRSLKN